jgi:pyrroline-5-carboxylate reductase
VSRIGFIGGGNMAEALIKGMIAAKVYPPESIVASDIRAERLEYLKGQYGIGTESDNASLARSVARSDDILILSVKPQNMTEALESIRGQVGPNVLVISIAAGIKVVKITDVLGEAAIVRVMPNTPALIGQGASALFANEKAKAKLDKATSIFSAVGKAVVVEDEGLIDAVTAVSGSGPAYYFLLMEEMIKAAGKLGLPDDVAKDLVLQTAKGAALLAAERDKQGETPAQLRKKVTSPGGTTEAALKIFSEGGLGEIISRGIERACERSKELSG